MTTKNFKTLSTPVLADPQRRANVQERERALRETLALAEVREAHERTHEAEAVEDLDVS